MRRITCNWIGQYVTALLPAIHSAMPVKPQRGATRIDEPINPQRTKSQRHRRGVDFLPRRSTTALRPSAHSKRRVGRQPQDQWGVGHRRRPRPDADNGLGEYRHDRQQRKAESQRGDGCIFICPTDPIHLTESMARLEKVRLQQLYEAALRRWGQIHGASRISGDNTWLVQEVEERDAAKDRLELHEQRCETCARRRPRSRADVA